MKKILLFMVFSLSINLHARSKHLYNSTNEYDIVVEFDNNGKFLPIKNTKDHDTVVIPSNAQCVKITSSDPNMKISKDCLSIYNNRCSQVKSDDAGNAYILADHYDYTGPYNIGRNSCRDCSVEEGVLSCQCYLYTPPQGKGGSNSLVFGPIQLDLKDTLDTRDPNGNIYIYYDRSTHSPALKVDPAGKSSNINV